MNDFSHFPDPSTSIVGSADTAHDADTEYTKLTVFDPSNKLVAYSGLFRGGIREVVSCWGEIWVLCGGGPSKAEVRPCVTSFPSD